MTYEIKKFKDGQVAGKILKPHGDLHLKIRGSSYEDLFAAASVKEAWDSENLLNKSATSTLTLYCLIGQRSDRRFTKGDSFDLKIIAHFINQMNFDLVEIFHPHSSVSMALINNSIKISHLQYVTKAFNALEKALLVSPDAGAYKSTHEIAVTLKTDLVPSNKVRINGKPQIKVQGSVADRDCLIVDDLADGGRTFMQLAEELKKQGAIKVFLYVSHAQFNYGFEELKQSIDHVYCTNSFKNINDDFVTQYKII